ncbi:MAG: ATP-binding protein [Cyanobacteria bacterium P01_G01_bin.54]
MELQGDWDQLCAQASGNPQQPYPTLSLALTVLPRSEWQALTPSAPLRRWRLVELGESQTLTRAPLRLDEQILHYLMGVQYLDQRLAALLELVQTGTGLVASHQTIAARIAQLWQQSRRIPPVIQLCGANGQTKRAIAQAVAQQFQAQLFALPMEVLATQRDTLSLTQCLIEREWRLNRTMVLLDFDYADQLPPGLQRFVDTLNVPLLLSTMIRYNQRHRPIVTFDVAPPTVQEQQQLWLTGLDATEVEQNNPVHRLVSHFNLTPGQIQSACLTLAGSENPDFATLWEICRTQSRPRLDELAQRIEVGASWSDLVLPEREQLVLQAIAAQVRQRMRVYQDWGFGQNKQRGLGISALFAGASGTGKTLAAEAIAAELKLDVYRIDLSSIISKYIGETEKNLRKLFDAAEGGGVILLFDEADALFGKRSEVRDSHDRHANVEVAYLLQRMEAFQGLAILTTNLKSSLDQAFLRRIRFLINFPFPRAPQREEIWRRVFPQKTPTQNLEYELLAQLEVTGGNIKSIAMNAAFIAAEADEPIQMKHLLQATRSEYIKIEKVLTDAEIRDWVD